MMQGFRSGALSSAFSTPSRFPPCAALHRLSVCASVRPSVRPPSTPSLPACFPPHRLVSHRWKQVACATSPYESPRGARQASGPPHRHVNSCSAHRYAQDEPLECGHFVRAQRGDYKLADSLFSIMECSLRNLDRVLPQRIIAAAALVFCSGIPGCVSVALP